MRIYVGNLSYKTTEEELRKEFSAFGKVDSVNVVTDHGTGVSRGFAFVEMPVVSEGQAAINALNGKLLTERTLIVNAARPPGEGRSGGGYRDNRGSGYGGGYGNQSRGYGGNRGRR